MSSARRSSSATTILSLRPSKVKQLELGKNFWLALKDFFENTTLHGYLYLIEPNRHWLEKYNNSI